jgi:hypothetical protein
MILAEFDCPQRLLKIPFEGRGAPEDVRFGLEIIRSLLADIEPEFLPDLSGINPYLRARGRMSDKFWSGA